ncbi:MAG: lipid A deacylase LpxR family protein [Gammaproteobacteria bacterium]|nr:lipid A deacylase LpxR family protein [Gammaproteobacteria bacterium]MDX5375523.1 lipid A deacylase LpxR family protein [Gammaproteobacteria bacterium]
MMKPTRLALRFLALLPALLPASLFAEELPGRTGTFSFVLENDLFYDADRHYTNGVRFLWVPGSDTPTPAWAVKLAGMAPWFSTANGRIEHGYAFGQSMFTPRDISTPDPSPDDRPYAGWLYGTIGLGLEQGQQLDQFGLTVGMVGPASFAEQTQKFVHDNIAGDDPQGWDTQLQNELGVVLLYQRSWRGLVTRTFSGNQLDFTPHFGATLGNVFTYANAGLTLRYGERLPNDYGPPRIQPGLPGSGDFSPSIDFRWYLFAGYEARAVARNIFLDGNTWDDSRSVDRKPIVSDFQFGLVADWQRIRLSYTHVLRTREFETQEESDAFGAFNVSWKF